MSRIDFFKNSGRRFSLQHFSIQKRLPLLICVLLLCVIVAFSLASYIGVKKAALGMGKERLGTLTEQLSSMFGQSAQALVTATRRAAGQETVKNYLLNASTASDTAAFNVLQKLRLDSSWVAVELLDVNRKPVLHSGLPGIEIKIDLDKAISSLAIGPDSCKIGKLYPPIRGSIYYPIIAAVTEKKQVIGYIVRWRLQKATAKAIAQFSQLLGDNTTLYVGNKDESLWSDMNKAVAAPPVELKQVNNFFEYTRPKADRVIATARPVANTQWLILIEVSEQSILQAANRFFQSIIIIGAGLIAIGIFIAWLMSRNITLPLKKLTSAASAIAGGDYAASVEIDRRDELGQLARAFNAMAAQVGRAQQDLEKKVQERTTQLEKANKELEAFSYSVSHDLRAPLRAISGYAIILKEDYASGLDEQANHVADKIIGNAKMMGQLIDDLISFSQIGRKEIKHLSVDMKKLADSCIAELLEHNPENKYQVHINPLPACHGDENLIKQVWMNLISNALKYSSKKTAPRIEIGYEENSSFNTYFIRDNGVGFDMQYAHKLFGVFQRLHSQKEFEGTGVGLALAKRIINQHNGEIRAESVPGQGAAFYFSLLKSKV